MASENDELVRKNARLSDQVLSERKRRQVAEARKDGLLEENELLRHQLQDAKARIRELEIALNAPG